MMDANDPGPGNRINHTYDHAVPITKSDTVELPKWASEIYVGGTGDITLITVMNETVLLKGIPVGTRIPVRTKQVLSTGTTATFMVAWY